MLVTSEDIKMISKPVLLNCFHKCLRLWFTSGKLDPTIINDPDIKPYFTPCKGHITVMQSSSCYDEIDGVLPMEAYCSLCQLL